tara:strand:+ start:745 stop:1284 length:540 start_codon:yes stop_codon:yes gene_type:complete
MSSDIKPKQYIYNIGYKNSVISDKRLSSQIQPITNGLEIIRQLKPKKYIKHPEFFIPEGVNSNLNLAPYKFYEIGLISQDILTINDLSHTIMTVPYNSSFNIAYAQPNVPPAYELFDLKYHEINTYTIKAVQELDNLVKLQQEQINTQQEQINTYQSQIDTLLSEVNILKNKLSNTNIF